MRNIESKKIAETVESLCGQTGYELTDDVLAALKKAAKKESNPTAVNILNQLIENAQLASAESIPLCQDTGLAVVFVEQGSDTFINCPQGKTISDAINEGIAAGYDKGYLRKSIVAEPLNKRINTNTNTPAIIHHFVVPGDKLKITLMAKGGGCENKSQFKMFTPTAQADEITDWIVNVVAEAGADACPPLVVGVGIGGNFERSCLLSKKALLRRLDDKNPDKFYAKLEQDLLKKINALDLGPQGFGGDTTALACLIESAPCHIVSLPVAVNIECHSHRHKSVII